MKHFVSLFALITLLVSGFFVPDRVQAIEGLEIQSGEVDVRHQWEDVTFGTTFVNQPIVLAQIQTENGGQAAYVDIRNLTTTSFQIRIEEDRGRNRSWLNGWHYYETIKWIAFDPNEVLAGQSFETGIASFNQADPADWETISFTETFSEIPLVFSQLNSENGRHTARMDLQNITGTSVELQIEEDTGNGTPGDWDGSHLTEDVGYLAFDPAGDYEDDGLLVGSDQVDSTWTTVCFRDDCSDAFTDIPAVFTDIQSENETDVANADINNVTVAGFEVRIEELPNAGWDATHVVEDVAWIAYGEVIPEVPVYNPTDYSVLIIDTGSNTVPIIEGILLVQGYAVDIEETAIVYGGIDTSYAAVIIPGGEQIVWDAMDASLQAVFQDYADQGGGVIGICGGSIAGSDQASFIDYGGWTIDMFGIGIGVTANYDTAWTSYIGGSYNPDVEVVSGHEILDGQYAVGDTFEMAYRGGPVFTGGTTILSYTEDIDSYPATGEAAAVASEYDGDGDGVAGQVILFALHPELVADTYFLLENSVQYVIEN